MCPEAGFKNADLRGCVFIEKPTHVESFDTDGVLVPVNRGFFLLSVIGSKLAPLSSGPRVRRGDSIGE